MEKSAEQPRMLEMPRIYDPRGSLTFVQNTPDSLPFGIRRVFWTYDVPAGEGRGGHAHRVDSEIVIAVNGSFRANLFDGHEWSHFTLNRPNFGLLVPPGYWRTLDDFSSGSVCLVLASELYDALEYIYDFDEFLKIKGV